MFDPCYETNSRYIEYYSCVHIAECNAPVMTTMTAGKVVVAPYSLTNQRSVTCSAGGSTRIHY